LYFDPDNLSFSFLGEEGAEHSNSNGSLKQQILKFFAANRKIYFTAVEISHTLDSDRGYTRNCLAELKADGLLSVIQTPGFANKYFLDFDGDYQVVHHPAPDMHPPEGFQILGSASLSASMQGGACHTPEKISLGDAPTPEKKDGGKDAPPCTLEDPNNSRGFEGMQGVHTETPLNGQNAPLERDAVVNSTSEKNEPRTQLQNEPLAATTEEVVNQITQEENYTCSKTGLPLPKPFTIEVDSPLGISTAAVRFTKVQNDHKVAFSVEFNFANGTTSRKHGSISKGKAEIVEIVEKEIKKVTTKAIKHPSKKYKVQQILGSIQNPEVRWVAGCKCVEVPDSPHSDWWVFQTEDGEFLQVAGDKEFVLEVTEPKNSAART
jgi:uncharacterized protein YaiE (UPF0345 family)